MCYIQKLQNRNKSLMIYADFDKLFDKVFQCQKTMERKTVRSVNKKHATCS